MRAALLALALLASPAPAQEAAPEGAPDYAAWAETAARAEAIAEAGRGSAFALTRLRQDLVGWRDAFSAAQAANAGRIATAEAQVAALGPAPAEGEGPEDARVAERRAALAAELARLRAPGLLAQEAYAQADGLIGEMDALARSRQATQLLERAPLPLDPRSWGEAGDAVASRALGLAKEVSVSVRSPARRATFAADWPAALLFVAAGIALILRGRPWLKRLAAGPAPLRGSHGAGVWRFALSLGTVLVPLVGAWAVVQAFDATGLFGSRATALASAIPVAAASILVPRWLAWHFFGSARANPAPFDFPPEVRAEGRRRLRQAGWVLAAATLLRAFLSVGDLDPAVESLILLPLDLVLALLLFRLGGALAAPRPAGSPPENDLMAFRRRLVRLTGRAAQVVAVVVALLSLLGFHRAEAALLMPAVLTLALAALLVLLQWLATDLYAVLTRREDNLRDALLPVLAGFALAALALPVLALVWGARPEDLRELWTRFQEGFTLGDTRLSPGVLATFAAVFALGFLITRLIQGTLRATVLPKTRLDAGAQNAVVSGLGYLGVLLSALLAVTTAGLDLSNLAIVAGALSVGIGFGLQTVVSNFVSGIILLVERPISEGDWIEVGGRMGYVRDISVRSTRIETFDRTDVIVPNADLVSGQVVNWTRGNLVGRIILPVSVAYGTDVEEVTRILKEAAEGHPMVLLSPPPAVVLAGFGADAVNFEIRAIIRDVNFGTTTRSEINHVIARRFLEAGIRTAGSPAPAPAPPKPAMA